MSGSTGSTTFGYDGKIDTYASSRDCPSSTSAIASNRRGGITCKSVTKTVDMKPHLSGRSSRGGCRVTRCPPPPP
jgi:hypothetical protein